MYTGRRQNIDPPADCGNGTSMCDDSTKSGDCGFRDTGCGTTSFEVTLTDPDGVDDFLVPLQKSRTTDDCEMLVCIACLTNSGFVVNGSNSSNSNITGSSRRRNSTYQHSTDIYMLVDFQDILTISVYPQIGLHGSKF